jgi:hypothetical protein
MEKYSKDKIESFKFRLNIDLKKRYIEFCKNNGFIISKRIRILLENDMKNGK